MKILLIGGTRLLGLSFLGKIAINHNYEITVLSRRKVDKFSNVHFITGEKEDNIHKISNKYYDIVLDFISYNPNDIENNIESLNFGKYYFISSIWLAKISSSENLDKIIHKIDDGRLSDLPETTQRYLSGKIAIENYIYERNKTENKFNIIRLPIFWGANDHTGRAQYYVERVIDDHDILVIDDGRNKVQIAWVEDLAEIIRLFVEKGGDSHLVWEAIPHLPIKIIDIYHSIENTFDKTKRFISRDLQYFNVFFPDYLEFEPLWREKEYKPTKHNLFSIFDIQPTPYSEWIARVSNEIVVNNKIQPTDIRQREIKRIQKL